MERFVLFALGALARALSAVLAFYADWLFNQLSDGFEGGLDLMRDLWQFARALVTTLAERLAGRSGRGLRMRDDDDLEPGYYGR